MKNSTNHLRHQSAFVDGYNYTNAYGTASFSPGRGNLILTIDDATSIIF